MRRTSIHFALASLLLVVGCTDSGDGATDVGMTTTTSAPEASGLAFFVPSWLPEGVSLSNPVIQREGQETPLFVSVLGRAGDDGAHVDVIRVGVSTATADREVSADEPVEEVRVGATRARKSTGIRGDVTIDWFHEGRAVFVTGPSARDSVIVEVARRVRLEGTTAGDARLDGTPAGYEEVAAGRSHGFPRQRASLLGAAPDGRSLHVSVQVTPPSALPLAAAVVGTELRSMRVRGKDATAATATGAVGGLTITTHSISWFERGDLMATVMGTQISEADVLRVAESLEEVDEDTFMRVGAR